MYQCIELPNREGYTAIDYALKDLNKIGVEHMLKHPSAHRLYLDYCPGDTEYTVTEIIMEAYPDLQPLVPDPLMESLDSLDTNKKLLAALQHDKYKVFLNISIQLILTLGTMNITFPLY
jgi:hypothetical protein